MKLFWSTICGGLFVAAALILWADPAGRWHHAPQFPDRPMKPGEVWVSSRQNFDDRGLRFSQIQKMDRPDVVLLGSSRVMKVSTAMWRPGLKVFNLGVTLPVARDFMAFWQALKVYEKVPRYVVLFADPWVLNKGVSFEYRVHPRYLFLFAGSRDTQGWLTKPMALLSYGLSQAGELLRMSELVYALHYLIRDRYHETPARIASGPSAAEVSWGIRWDGSLQQPLPPVVRAQLDERVADTLSHPRLIPFTHWELDRARLRDLQELFAEMHQAGIEVLIVLPPYEPTALHHFQTREPYKTSLEHYREAWESLEGGTSGSAMR